MGSSSSCSSPGNKSYDGEEYFHNLEITDESALDGEVGKGLNQMIPVPVSGAYMKLQLYDLAERKVQGDGNCQFCALSDQFYHTPEHHKFVRKQVVNQLKSHRDTYEGYVTMEYDDYLKKMSKSGEWGDHVTLQAAADAYGVKIFVITPFRDTCSIEILPKLQKSKQEFPEGDSKRKKRWPFGRKY